MARAKKRTRRVALYVRVSTDGQTTKNQRIELQGIAERSGWHVVKVYEDNGISGAKGREKRPAFDQLHSDAARREFDLVAAWSVDRLGRSLQDLLALLGELHALGIDLYLHQQGVDTTTPAGKAMFQMMGVFAEFERAIIRERVKAGLARAKQTREQHQARKDLLTIIKQGGVQQTHGITVEAPDHLADDPGADHLDALLCAIQAAWAWTQRDSGYGQPHDTDPLEGWIADPTITG